MRAWVLWAAVGMLAAGGAVRGDAPAISPAVTAAIKGLSADDYAAREKAVANLQLALGQELRAMIPGEDPEGQARFAELLTFEQGLCAWAKDVLKLPPEKQKEALDFGLRPEVLPQVAHLYSPQTNTRVEAVKALRKMDDPQATDLLAKALNDLEQSVYVAAMEGVYDRPPTVAVAEALWSRAVAAQFAAARGQPQAGPDRITFRGRQIQPLVNGDNTLYQRTQDNALATDVLAHIQAPEVAGKLKALLDETEAVYNRRSPNGQDNPDIWIYMPSQEAMKNATRLMEAYRSRELVPGLYRIATGPVLQRQQGQINVRQVYFWSNRTWALALVAQIAGQNPTDWNLRTMAQLQGMWVTNSEAEENAAVVKVRDWWSKEHDKYGAPEDTRPALPPQDPLPPQVAPPRVRILPLMQ